MSKYIEEAGKTIRAFRQQMIDLLIVHEKELEGDPVKGLAKVMAAQNTALKGVAYDLGNITSAFGFSKKIKTHLREDAVRKTIASFKDGVKAGGS